MAEMRTSQLTALRRAIDCLPRRTREAMLAGIDNNTIVVGAYATADGVCPMLAAHRAGGRTNFIAFARAWDEFCFRGVTKRKRRPRLATRTELVTLRAHIEASMLAEENVDLSRALTEHDRLRRDRADRDRQEALAASPHEASSAGTPGPPAPVRPGDPDRSAELSRHPGWRWLRIMRSYDEYEQVLAELDSPQAERELAHSRH
jgi:hypothetical protein